MEIEEGPAIVRKGLPTRVRRGFRLLAVTATLCCVFVTVYSQWCLDKDLGVNDGGLILVGLVQYRTALASSVVNSIFILSQLMPEGKTPKVLEATLKVKEGVAAASGTLQVVISIIAFIRSGSSYSILSLRFEAMQSIYRTKGYEQEVRTIDTIQTEMECCGTTGPSSWERFMEGLPGSCYKKLPNLEVYGVGLGGPVNNTAITSGCTSKLGELSNGYLVKTISSCLFSACFALTAFVLYIVASYCCA